MEFVEGGQVNDRNYMKKHGICVNEVLSTGFFFSMLKCVFITGFSLFVIYNNTFYWQSDILS